MPNPETNIPLNTLKDFALTSNIRNKGDKEFGEKIVLQIENLINSSYFRDRNMRFAKNRQAAAGKMDMTIFMDLLDMNGKVNYTKLNWKAPMIVNTIVSRLVGRWMANRLKPKAEAVDPVSVNDKKEKIDDAEFYLDNKEMLAQMEDQSGVPMIPKDQFIAEDKDHLDLWAQEELRLPEEILYEKGIRTVFRDNKLDTVMYRKMLHDSAEVGLIGTETVLGTDGTIKLRKCVPENQFYSNTDTDDFSDCSIMGEVVSLTLSELRCRYPKLSEEEIFDIAKVSKDWQENSKITWNSYYNNSLTRPYDDWNVDVANFELKTLDVDGYQMKITKNGSLVIDRKNYKPENLSDNKEYSEKEKWNIYRGCYVRSGGKRTLLEWGEKKNKITPQDPQYIGEAKFSYSFYMYQNVNMRNVAIPEKIEEPVEQMILARLKIQQLVAKMRAAGYKYDIDGMQEMDLGGGNLTPLELQRVTDQTGNVYYRGRAADGSRIENPVTENPNAGSVPQLQQLILIYNFHNQVLKDELGEDTNLIQQASTPRVTSENVKVALQEADNATGHMSAAVRECLTETANKVACLLHDSVEYGAEAYRTIMQEKDVKNRVFKIQIEMLPNEQEIMDFVMEVNQYVKQHPDFVLYISPFKLRTLAQENLRLAALYFENAQKKAIKGQMEQAAAQSKMNGDIQVQSAGAKAEADAQLLQIESSGKTSLSGQDFVQQAMLLSMNPANIVTPAVQAIIDEYLINLAKQKEAAMQQEQEQAMEQQPQEQPM